MGPITIFDKSLLESLSLNEAVGFDNFLYSNITPLFFVETLPDLGKAVRVGRTPEQEVRIIADKAPISRPGFGFVSPLNSPWATISLGCVAEGHSCQKI